MGSLDKNVAAWLTSPYGQPYIFESQSQPTPSQGEVVVRLDVSGVCHGDLYVRDGGGPAPEEPIRPLVGGHEGVGVIIDMSAELVGQKHGFKHGDTVGIAWRQSSCGQCEACLEGAGNYCHHQVVNGLHRNGTFQRFITYPVDGLVRIPAEFSVDSACPILCAGVTAYTALRRMKPLEGEWCAIVGAAGSVGHLAIQYAKRIFNLKVIGIDGGSDKKDMFCRDLGCDEYVDYIKSGNSLADEVLQKTMGGARYALVLGPHQQAYDGAGKYMRFGGHIMAVGIGNCQFSLRSALRKKLTISASNNGTHKDIEEALQASMSHDIRAVTYVLDILELNGALDQIQRGQVLGKLVVRLDGDALHDA